MCIDMALTAFKWIHAVKKRVTQPILWNGLPQVAYNSLLVQVRAKIPQSYTQQNEDYGSKWSLYFFYPLYKFIHMKANKIKIHLSCLLKFASTFNEI